MFYWNRNVITSTFFYNIFSLSISVFLHIFGFVLIIYFHVYLQTNPRKHDETSLIFKWSLNCLNTQFSFS